MNINFELYKVFYHVAKNLSFSQAAQELFISQSAISQSIKLLEEKHSCQLFTRNKKRITLTPEGVLLYKYIEQAYQFILSGQRSIAELHSLQQGEIKIAASDTICKYYLLPYFKQFNQQYPDIKIKVINRTSPVCIDLLEQGLVDLIVINIPSNFSNNNLVIQNQRIIQDVIIAGIQFRHLCNRTVSLAELGKYPFLMLEKNTVTRQFFDNLVTAAKVNITPEIELGSIDILIELVKIGLGLSFVTKEYTAKELATGELLLVNIQEQIPARYLGVITHRAVPLPPAALKFMELLTV